MAWYYGTFACGHEGRVNIIGRMKDREWKAEREFAKVCKECWLAAKEREKQQKNEEAAKLAEEMELPELEGTEKQVAWANTLRVNFIDKFNELIRRAVEKAEKYPDLYEKEEYKIEDWQRMFDYLIQNQTKASFWIDTRTDTIGSILLSVKDVALLSDEEQKIIEDVKVESTVFPEEKVTDAVAEITVKPNCVSVTFERNEDFRKLVKSLGYTWEGSAWEKAIKETTGSAAERAAELGNKLLNAGFPIRITDEEIRKNAIEGFFDPECRRWVYRHKDKDVFLIKWEGYNDSLYQKARSLPGAKWSNPFIVVDVAHYLEVEEFAELYGFQFTKAAIKLIEAHKEQLKKIETVAPAKVKEENPEDGLEKILKSGDDIIADLKD